MWWLALKMLVGDQKKYWIITFGVAFSSVMMAHQMAVFWGIMLRTVHLVRDIHPDGIWVCDANLKYVDETRPLAPTMLTRIRSTPGVQWAVPLHHDLVHVETDEGTYRQATLVGVDRHSLFGAPPRMLQGNVEDLRFYDGVIIDRAGYSYLWPGEELYLNRYLEINQKRLRIVGICDASPPFQSLPIIFANLSNAIVASAQPRHVVSFVLVGTDNSVSDDEICRRIESTTGLRALSSKELCWETLLFYFRFTGIPINFGIVVGLGFVVGVSIAGQNFYLFTADNLRQFGMLKALGTTNGMLLRMIVLQATVVGIVGYGLGMGLAALLIETSTANIPHLAGFFLPWQIMLATGTSVMCIMLGSSVVSIWRVLREDPATVFRS